MADPDRVRIYALADPAALFEAQDAIGRLLRSALRLSDPDRHTVAVSPSSGWLTYEDDHERSERTGPPRLPDAEGAQAAGEAFLRTAAKALDPGRPDWPASLRGITPVPPVFRAAGLLSIVSPRGRAFDHWLYRAQAFLPAPADGRTSALVLGAQAEVRVGDGGRVVAFVVRWRALSGEVIEVDATPYVPDGHGEDRHRDGHDDHGDDGGGDDEAPPPRLVYVLEGDGVPQHYLAPYHLVEAGHHGALVSASPYSLTVTVTEEPTDEGTRLTALASGGSGRYAYNWARYAVDGVVEHGVQTIGPGVAGAAPDSEAVTSSVTVAEGAWVVLLNVKDRATGAFKHHQQQVFTGPRGAPSRADTGWGR